MRKREVEVSGGERAELRDLVFKSLMEQGFSVCDGQIVGEEFATKAAVRALHSQAVARALAAAEPALRRHEESFLQRLAHSESLRPAAIMPELVEITDRRSQDSLFWRWAGLHWSVPVSSGYGRRMRFLIVDKANNCSVIGILGLADPVFAIRDRDSWIGWDHARRRTHLAHVMDAFALGAVPPYSFLLGSKLIALLATSSEVRSAFEGKYSHRRSLISGRSEQARLALLTTASALGRSSMYNRLQLSNRVEAWRPVGYTQGSGDFQFSGEIYTKLSQLVRCHDSGDRSHRHPSWTGNGPRNRREVVQRGLDILGLDGRALRNHGIRRQLFVAPLAHNAAEWLAGSAADLEPMTASAAELASWWRARWAVPRSERTSDWRNFQVDDMRLWGS